MIEIKEVLTRKQMKQFVKFPLELYKDSKLYVPSLSQDEMNISNPKKNLSLGNSEVKCFLAFKDGKLAGRIAGTAADACQCRQRVRNLPNCPLPPQITHIFTER